MTSVSTETASVPPPADLPRRRSRRWLTGLVLSVVLVTLLGVGATTVTLPWYAVAPGSAVAVDTRVRAGVDPPSESSLHLLTVRLAPVTLVGAVRGWIDPEVGIVAQGRARPPGVGEGEMLAYNLTQMEASKRDAIGVALEELGYDAISGKGAEVLEVTAGTPADMVLVPGDTVVGIDGAPVTTHHDVIDGLALRQPGTRVELMVDGAGAEPPGAVAVALDAAPGQPHLAFLGATFATRDARANLPFRVGIAVEDVGGPSAGLAFALGVLDVLSGGDLTGEHRVAATGTIALDGSVGPVGGITQKTAVAVREGMDLLLVPGPEADEARRLAGDDLAVEGVDSLSDALQVLADHGGDPLSPRS